MSTTRSRLLCFVALGALLAAPLAAWAFIKPLRVLAPTLAGVQCPTSLICIDDPSRLQEAVALGNASIEFVTSELDAPQQSPRFVFCARAPCAASFGAGLRAAYTFGTFGIVVAPRGWEPHYVRHELIHHLQNERLGSLRAWLLKPTWFTEGMAYSLSDDPRHPLPEPMESYRVRFASWLQAVGIDNLWVAADSL